MISKGKVWLLILALGVLTLPQGLCAQDVGKNTNYFVLKLGNYLPQSSDLDNQDAGNGFLGQIGFGYYLNRHFSIECDLGYFETKGNAGNYGTKIQFLPLEISGRLGLPINNLEPYILGGLGGYRVDSHAGSLEKTSYRAGGFAGGGVNLNLGQSFFIGIEGRYLWLAAPTTYVTPYNISSSKNIDLDGVIVTGNIGFRF